MKTRRPAPPETHHPPPSDHRLVLLLSLLALLVYNANFRLLGAGDAYLARFLPFAPGTMAPSTSTRSAR